MVSAALFTLVFLVIKTSLANLTDKEPVRLDSWKNVTTMFVDGKTGSDSFNCGQQSSPCKTVHFAVHRVFDENSTSAVINVFPGMYEAEAVKIDCSTRVLDKLVIQGLG
jgi:hypothetical protein